MLTKILRCAYCIEIVLLLFILACYVGHSFFIGTRTANGPTELSSAVQVNDLPEYGNALSRHSGSWLRYLSISSAYPPLYYVTGTLIVQVFGRNYMALNLVNNFSYLVLLLVFGYLLGREIKDRTTGVIAGILLSLYPLVYGPFRTFCVDFPLLGLTVMSVYFLVRSDCFNEMKWSIFFALSCGWAMMVKDTFAVFIMGPFLYCVGNAAREIAKGNYRPALNIAVSTVLFSAIIAPYYFDVKKLAYIIFERQVNEPLPRPIPWYAYENLKLFTTGFINQQLSPVFFVALLSGLFPFFRNASLKIKVILVSWILIPNVILIFVPHVKSARYLMPALPAFALISAFGMRSIIEKHYGKAFLALIVTLGIAQYFWFTYGKSSNPGVFWAGSRQLRYFQCSEMNQSLYLMKKNSKILESMYRGITGRDLAGKKELTVFVPFRGDGSPGLEDFLNVHFWFQNSGIRVREELFNNAGPERLYWLRENVDDIDFMMFFLPLNEVGDDKDRYRLSIAMIKKYFNPFKRKVKREHDWPQYEPLWEEIVTAFDREEILYSDDRTVLYLYSRSTGREPWTL